MLPKVDLISKRDPLKKHMDTIESIDQSLMTLANNIIIGENQQGEIADAMQKKRPFIKQTVLTFWSKSVMTLQEQHCLRYTDRRYEDPADNTNF
ncbi:hypothetical protein HXA35_18260 [Bacillus sp. A301a_S52]|nr:hypothetical protein [Bacillus sp. A301a_S52]